MSKVYGNRYEVIEKIGAGGMAIVYKAKDLLLNRVVTIKVLREQFATDEDFVRRFRREAQNAASLSHTNIVSIYDVGKDGDTEYIVMEYVEGRNLKELIRNYAPLTADQAIHLALQIAEAISHAHEHQIIHRDIKPHNILVTENGKVKVTDFGIARAVSAATMTHTGDIVGSVHYLSPEQAKGVQTNEQSDVYSLGIILYELLTGKVPYDGETPITIALKHLQEVAVPPSKINPKTPLSLENVILRAIAKLPEQRYGTARELIADLQKVTMGQTVYKSEGLEESDLESTRVHRALGSDVTNRGATERQEEGTPKAPGPSEKAPQNKRNRLWLIGAVLLLLLGGGWFGLSSYLNVGSTKVPPLVGRSVADAGVFVKQVNLVLDPNVVEEFSDTIEKGRIIRTLPSENSVVKNGREIKLWVSKGPELVKFPNLKTGQITQEAAINLLESMGFKGKITIEPNLTATEAAGIVVGQNPPPGTDWTKSGDIRLQVSSGTANQSFPLPSVLGKSVQEAKALLEQYKLTVVMDSKDSTEFPRDVVMATNPKPGEMVQQGAVVTVTVSRGPGPLALNSSKEKALAKVKKKPKTELEFGL